MTDQQNNGDEKQGMSFAERYASKKRSPMTSQQLSTNSVEENQTEEVAENSSLSGQEDNLDQDTNSEQKTDPNKKIDPRKKMQAELIYLVKGIDAGRNAWYYVLVDRLKVQLFLKALNDEIIHLENYGKILFSAYGDEPPADITSSLKEEYGIS